MEQRESRFPANLINVRVQANSSYQLKRVLGALEKEKGLLLMSKSDIKTNHSAGPRLRQFATYKDLKMERNNNWKKYKNENKEIYGI